MSNSLETKLLNMRTQPVLVNILSLVIAALLVYAGGLLLPARKLAKAVGGWSAFFGMLCLAYYVVKLVLLQAQKRQLPSIFIAVLRFLFTKLLALHYLSGTLMLYLAAAHGYLFYAAGRPLASSSMAFGFVSLFALLLVMITGFILPHSKVFRAYHRHLFGLAVIFYILHLTLKFSF